MEQQREACNLMIIFLLAIASVHDVSSQNLYTVTTTIDTGVTDGDKITDHSWLQPLNTTMSIYQDSTTYLPSTQTEEILDSSETHFQNRYARPFAQHYTEDDDPEEPPDHVIPYSEHEEARDVPTQPKYVAPGIWAKPPPGKDIPLDFVPTKLHAQVRGTHTVKRLPQRQAIESAETDEERRNAPRLREVVTNSKVNTVYTEEGYEDSAYDHAGHIRDADFREGFARKLHNQKTSGHSSSNGKRKGKDLPDEFEEYEEDYQDHLQENRKEADDDNNLIEINRDSWEESEINPKFVAQNNIQKLEEDIERDAEEAERSSKIYQNAQESKLRNDIKIDSSEEPHVDDGLKHENKSTKSKKKKSKSRNGKKDNVGKGVKQSRKLKRKKKLYSENYETTSFPFQEASSIDAENPHGFVTNSPNSQIYSIDQTTLRYVVPVTTASFRQAFDEPTTASYSQRFWDYFKERQDPSTESSTESSTFGLNSTTMNPQQEARTPIAVATIDGHGPYLLVTKEETVTSPSTFFDPYSDFRPRNLFADHVEFSPTPAQMRSRHLLGSQSDGVNYVNNVITASTVATFDDVPSLNPEGVEYSSSTLLDTTVSSSTPAVMTINFTQEAYARIADYHENPFLGPVLGNSNIAVARNKLKYKVLARAKPSNDKKPVKSVAQSPGQQVTPSFSKKEKEQKNIRDELNAKYNKMLSYIKSKQETQFPKEKKILFPEDLTLRRPPIQRAAYSILVTDHPAATNRSSVSTESESPRESSWRDETQTQRHSQPVKLPYYHFDPFAHVQPAHPIYRKNSFPTTKLLPPPLPLASNYANYRGGKQNDHSHPGGKSQQRRDNPFRYFPVNPEASRRTRSRRKRSDEGEFRDGGNATDVDVKAAANNGVTNDSKPEHKSNRDKSSFDRVIDRAEGKLSSRRVTDAIDVPDPTKLALPTRSRANESGTSRNKYSANGEREDARDARKMINGISKIDEKGPISIRSAEQNERTNDTDAVETAKKKRYVESETYLAKDLRNENDHAELLNESPKISGDVIDKEIAVRFNEKDDETSPETRNNGKIKIEVPSLDYVDELVEDDLVKFSATTEAALDLKKYPFYNNEDVPSASALKYVVDPGIIPRKTSRGMEFYNSRNAYKQCDEVEPDLDQVLPEKEEPDPERGSPQEDLPRLRGLGDKLDCFKAKYFDENPLDNPLFAEKLIEEPTPPTELNPTKFASKIMVLPGENDEYVVPQVSKKPERDGRQWRNRIRPYETLESIRVNYKHDPQTGRGRNAYLHTVRGTRLPNTMRRTKNRKSRPKISTTTPSPNLYQTDSYQNLVYEDVMGNIRNMKNTYQVYETTTLPPLSKQILIAAAGSENTLKVTDTAKEKSTSKPDVTGITDVTNKTKSSEIRGLVPPPKYLIYRQNYRKPRPVAKSRGSFIRSPTLPQIIAHHHTTKLNKRSTTDDTAMRNSSESINENKKATVNRSVEVDAVVNDTSIIKSVEKAMNGTNVTSEPLDLEIEESRPVSIQDRSLSTTLKINDKKKRRNYMSSDLKGEPQKIVYTIKDRIRYSKPKLDTRGVGKFTAISRPDEDSRRKEPRYNHIERTMNERQNNSTIINSTDIISGIESATSLIEDRESGTTEVYHAEESAVQQMIYHKKDEDPEVEKAENVDTESKESLFDEEESTTNTYKVRENTDEKASTTTARSTHPRSSKEVVDLREYLESDPPGYAEAFPEEATTPSSKYRANMNRESEDSEEKQEEETDYPRNPWDNDSFEKIEEEQVETPMKTEVSQDDDSEEFSSKEEQGSDRDQTFFTYMRRPTDSDKESDENSEKATSHKSFPFSRYRTKFEKESEENDHEDESEEKSEDYVFPWHADKENKRDKRRWLYDLDRYEYPWERRARLEKERKRRRQIRARIYDDEDEEESTRDERPIYSWERYNVPSKIHRVNTRRDISRRYIDDGDESSTEYVPKYSSRYSSSGAKPTKFSNAREISRSIKKFLEEEDDDASEERASKEAENRSPPFRRTNSDRGISRGTLVPEDVTQPPRRKNVRRKISQINKNVTNNSHFDSKKLNGEDTINEEKEEEPAQRLKLNKSDLDDSESPTEVTSSQPSQLPDGTRDASVATEQRKKRRRKIPRNNLPISLDNASAESVTKPTRKRRRRKPEASTTTSATLSASVDFDPRKSAFVPVQKRYSKKDEKTDRSDFSASAKTIATPKIIKADNFQEEASTPKTRTVEHRSRVSREKIITKTSYPNETESFDPMKTNRTSVRKEPVRLRMKTRRRKNNNEQDGKDNKKELIKQEDNEGNHEVKFANEDEIKKTVTDKPRDKSGDSAFRSLGMKREELKKINDFGTYDGIVNDENDNGNGGFAISSEIYAVRNLMQTIPPNQEKNRANERTKGESNGINQDWKKRNNNKEANEKEKMEDVEQKRKPLLQTKFIKDPEHRLYYYIERK